MAAAGEAEAGSAGEVAAATRGIARRKLIVLMMSEGVVRRDHALIEMIDFPLPRKTHKGSCRAAASFLFCSCLSLANWYLRHNS
jgi:hypothetical protein